MLEDVEEIKKLQRAYGFYLVHSMAEDLIDLFVERPDTELLVAAGHYKVRESIREKNHITSPTTTPRRRNINKDIVCI